MLVWEKRRAGWYEAQGERHSFWAVRAGSGKWELCVFDGGPAECFVCATLIGCKWAADRFESPRSAVVA